jgi:hypothetical protein
LALGALVGIGKLVLTYEKQHQSTTITKLITTAKTVNLPISALPPHVLVRIEGNLEMAVSDAESFLEAQDVRQALAVGIADELGVLASYVSVTVSKMAHDQHDRNLTGMGVVKVGFIIHLPDSSEGWEQDLVEKKAVLMTMKSLEASLKVHVKDLPQMYSIEVISRSRLTMTDMTGQKVILTTTTTSTTTSTTTLAAWEAWHPLTYLQSLFGDRAEIGCYSTGCLVMANANCTRSGAKLDLAALSNLVSKVLHLDLLACHDLVIGDLQAISSLSELRYLALSSPSVTGGTRSLRELVRLRHVSLHDHGSGSIDADLEDFRRLVDLEYFSMNLTGGEGLTGDMSHIAGLRHLETIEWARIEKVYGDLNYIQSPHMKVISLQGPSHIIGNLNYFAYMPSLQTLWIDQLQVSGNTNGLCSGQFLNISTIRISDAAFSGDLANMANCRGLKHLDLTHSMVSGSLKDLIAGTVQLETLRLVRTPISGKLIDLKPLQNVLIDVNLSQSNVEGCSEPNSCSCSGIDACREIFRDRKGAVLLQ